MPKIPLSHCARSASKQLRQVGQKILGRWHSASSLSRQRRERSLSARDTSVPTVMYGTVRYGVARKATCLNLTIPRIHADLTYIAAFLEFDFWSMETQFSFFFWESKVRTSCRKLWAKLGEYFPRGGWHFVVSRKVRQVLKSTYFLVWSGRSYILCSIGIFKLCVWFRSVCLHFDAVNPQSLSACRSVPKVGCTMC